MLQLCNIGDTVALKFEDVEAMNCWGRSCVQASRLSIRLSALLLTLSDVRAAERTCCSPF